MKAVDLGGRVALVTGSSRGIGRMSALYLAEAGCDVIINYKSDREAAEHTREDVHARGRRAYLAQCDVADSKAVESMVQEGIERFGRLDILVNNAGGSIAKHSWELTDADYEGVFNLNVRAYVAAARAALPGMKERGYGRIICVSSVVGRSGKAFVATSPAYAGAKGAIISYTRSMARECGPFGITVNAVCPGWILWEGKTPVPAAGLLETAVREIPIGRLGNEHDVASAVLFLASDMASYITGVSLDVNGGLYMA